MPASPAPPGPLRIRWALLRAQLRVWAAPRGRLVPPAPAPAARADADPAAAAHLARAVDRTARRTLPRPTCLVRALALQRLLADAGLPGARVRLGVRTGPRAFGAHAWVELHGQPLGDDGRRAAGFVPLAATAP